jgi:hypothetical protein
MIKLVLDPDGKLVAVEQTDAPIGVVRVPGTSLKRFVAGVVSEFPILVEVSRAPR